jgi:HD-like signal output (HDOD) protein
MNRSVTTEMLEGLSPLHELDEEALAALAAEAEVDRVPAKSLVFRRGESDGWTRYVISGEVLLVDDDAKPRRSIIGMGDAAIAAEPLGAEQPFEFNALTRSEVLVIRLSSARIRELLEARRLPEYGVDQLGDDGGASDRLFYTLVEDLMQDRLELPSMPDIAIRVREAVNDPDAGAAEVTRIVQADPVVAAQLLKAANSALYAGQKSVDSLNAAVVRLGLRQVRELVMAVTMGQVFRSRNPLLNKRMVELWMHSSLVAAIAAVMARRLPGFDSDRGLLAGLVHDIGVVPMLNHASDYEELARDPAMLENTIQAYRADIGSMILRRWNFPEEMVAVALEADNWQRERDGAADYADLVIAAQLQSYAGTPEAARYPGLESLSVYARLGLADVGVSDSAPILEEAREEIAEVQRFLMG